MNNFITKLTATIAVTTVSAFGVASTAFAGEGGVAGAAAFTIDTDGKVTGVAVASAVGKQDAAASAFNVPVGGTATSLGVQNYAYALGSGGIITMTSIGDPNGAGMAGGVDSNIDEAQINSFTSENTPGSIQLGSSTGDILVDFDAE